MAALYETDLVSKTLDQGDAIIRAYESKALFLATLAKRKKLTQVSPSWTVDAQGNAFETAVAEGVDATATPEKAVAVEVRARAQIFRSNRWMVTKTAEAVEQADIADEVVRQKLKCQETFMESIERALLSFQAAVATGTRKTRGAMLWLDSSAQAVDEVPASIRPTSAMRHTTALSGLSQTAFAVMLGAARDQLRKRPVLTGKVGWRLKRHMSLWGALADISSTTGALQRYNLNAAEKRLLSMIDFFEFDVGSVRTMITDYLACDLTTWAETDYTPRSGIFIDPTKWGMRWLRPIAHTEQTDEGAGRRGYYEGEGALICDTPQGQLTVYTNADT